LPDEDLAAVKDELVPPWLLHGLSVTLDEPPAAHHGSPSSHPVFQGIQAVLSEAYPKATIGPYFLAWTATDARFFRVAGVPSYGFSPFPNFSTDTYQVDRANERFGLPGFVEGVDVYRKVVRRLVSDR
jgi:acetylornithine deacetylase/succinyl-diaminopimelate desuccinylase-like protein